MLRRVAQFNPLSRDRKSSEAPLLTPPPTSGKPQSETKSSRDSKLLGNGGSGKGSDARSNDSKLSKTPPPSQRDSKLTKRTNSSHPSDPANGPSTPSSGPSRREVGPWLKNLIRAESMNDPQAQEAMKAMRELQHQCGAYLLASDIQNYLNRLPPKDDRGRVYNKDRGYGLAAELFLREAYRQIDAVEAENLALGPSLFTDYCVDIIDCFFARKNALKALEAPVALTEYLLQKAADSPELREVYLTLARTAMKTGLEAATARHEKELAASRAVTRKERNGDSSAPGIVTPAAPAVVVDQPVLAYLRDVQRKIGQINNALEHADLGKPSSGEEDPQKRARKDMEKLQGLMRLVHGIEFHPLTAYLKERIGGLAERIAPGSGQELYRAAASHLEVQAEREAALKLTTLVAERTKRACRLYDFLKEPASSHRLTQRYLALSQAVQHGTPIPHKQQEHS